MGLLIKPVLRLKASQGTLRSNNLRMAAPRVARESLLRLKALEQVCRFCISVSITGSKMFFGERFS